MIYILVACGKNHTLAVTEDGKLYTCGSNDFGQLGHDGPRTKLRTYLQFFNFYFLLATILLNSIYLYILILQNKLQVLIRL